MSGIKEPLELDELEASLALHALKFYINAKGNEISDNTISLEAKFSEYLSDTKFTVGEVENVASILGVRGGTKGGASTSEAKRAAAAANGAKGGRPHKPNLFIKFAKMVWQEPDPTLLNELYKLAGNNTWLPDEVGDEKEGPYVRMYVPEISKKLENLLSHSENVWEWDEKGLYRACMEHANSSSTELRAAEKKESLCTTCGKPAHWAY
jgi:hypothetical protein